jgi:hypothetical protein
MSLPLPGVVVYLVGHLQQWSDQIAVVGRANEPDTASVRRTKSAITRRSLPHGATAFRQYIDKDGEIFTPALPIASCRDGAGGVTARALVACWRLEALQLASGRDSALTLSILTLASNNRDP